MLSKKYLLVICIASLFSCSQNKNKETTDVAVSTDTLVTEPVPEVNMDTLLVESGKKVLFALHEKNYDAFSDQFEENRAIRFSPYGYVDTITNKRFTKAEFDQLIAADQKIYWGSYDGSGDSILLTGKQYINKFVYNANFLKAEKMAIDSFIGSGNSLNNLKTIYPGARFIEYHFSGFDKKYGGMDWTSLRLVFREINRSYKLIAIVHDQWTT